MQRLRQAGFRAACDQSVPVNTWWDLIARVGFPRYWEAFDLLSPLMNDHEYADTIRELWTAGNGLDPLSAARRLVNHGRTITREMWMTPADLETYRRLPEVFPVYRGCREDHATGWCWTLKETTAERFAADGRQSDGRVPMIVVRGTVEKHDVIALFSGEFDEDEVVVPGHLVRMEANA